MPFVEEALQSGATLALLASTCSSPKEGLVEAALNTLGSQVSERVRVFQCPQGGSLDADGPPDDDLASMEKSLHKEAAKASNYKCKAD